MEKDTVLLDLDTYTKLYELEKNIKDGKKLVVRNFYDGEVIHEYYTDDKLAEDLVEKIDALKLDHEKALEDEYSRHCHTRASLVEDSRTLSTVKRMGIIQLIKWHLAGSNNIK